MFLLVEVSLNLVSSKYGTILFKYVNPLSGDSQGKTLKFSMETEISSVILKISLSSGHLPFHH